MVLAKTERLGTRGLTGRVLRSGSFPFGTYKVLAGATPRAAVIISKKTCPGAPKRNRLRRRIGALIREFFRSGVLRESVIVYPHRSALTAAHPELRRSLAEALRVSLDRLE